MADAQAKTLRNVLAHVPDDRTRRGRRFTLQSVLALVLGALLAGRKGWSHRQPYTHAAPSL